MRTFHMIEPKRTAADAWCVRCPPRMYMYMRVCVYAHMYAHTYIRMRIYAYIHTYVCIHIHRNTSSNTCPLEQIENVRIYVEMHAHVCMHTMCASSTKGRFEEGLHIWVHYNGDMYVSPPAFRF